MKKKSLVFILAAILVLSLCLCACQKKEAEPETTQKASEAATTKAEETTAQSLDEDLNNVATTLIQALNKINRINSCALENDASVVYTDGSGLSYSLVTDPNFQSIGAIVQHCFNFFTDDFINAGYASLLKPADGEIPTYLYLDGQEVPTGLYMLQAGKGFPIYPEDGNITISNKTDTSFTFSIKFDDFGAESTAIIDAVKDGELWKVNKVTIEQN